MIIRGLEGVDPQPSVAAVGFFDGVHRGHQSLISRAVGQAVERGVRSAIVTFDRHPMEVVAPGSQPRLLQTRARRVRLLAAQGADLVVVIPFDDDLRHLSPEEFVERVLGGPLKAVGVVVGRNFRFGHKAAGDLETLQHLGEAHGFTAEGWDLLTDEQGRAISSTVIRSAVEAGDVTEATRLLGRPHALDGVVVRGDQRGVGLGFPTANLQVDERVVTPAPGVYATVLHHPDGRALPAATSIGTNPTFGGQQLRVEAYVLDTEENLYGLEVTLDICARVRQEERFEAVEELIEQMHEDVAAVRALLET